MMSNDGLMANRGKVGGWNISDSTFSQEVTSDVGTYGVYMQPPTPGEKGRILYTETYKWQYI